MALLTIDTASQQCAAHVARADGAIEFVSEEMGRGHAERLFPLLDDVLDKLKVSYDDIEGIGVTRGPGSFTGVRVGLSAARGLALALNVPIAGITSLAGLAASHPTDGPKLVLIDAKRGQVYAQLFDAGNKPVDDPMLLNVDQEPPEHWAKLEPLFLIGSGAKLMSSSLPHATILSDAASPDVNALAALTRKALAKPNEERLSAYPASPLYLRGPDAKPQNPASLIARAVPQEAQP